MSFIYRFTCLAVLAWLTGCTTDGTTLTRNDKSFTQPLQEEQEANLQLNTSALNTLLAFEPYHDLATRITVEPGFQKQQRNILFSPLGLASALALLSQVSRSESRNEALEALGLTANSTEHSVEATISALTNLLHNLTLREGGGGGEVQGAKSEAGNGTEDGTGATVREGTGGADGGSRADGDDGAEGGTVTEDTAQAGGQLKVWSSLHVDGKHLTDYDRFLSGPSTFSINVETLGKDVENSDKLELNNYVYFKGRHPFEQCHTVPRSFHLNATTSVEVSMMFKDDSDVMMLYDTNCSATVVQLALSEHVASLLLLPKAKLQRVEDCLSDGRMRFWLSNLKPGRAEILFPKFQLRKSYSLESLLRNSGVSSVFSDSPDFSGISQKKTLRLVKAPHEVMLEVEEDKISEGGRHNVMLDFSVPPRITFNRPFLLIIYDNLRGLVLFMGRITDPTDV